MITGICRFLRDENGLTSVEYALLLALLVVVSLGAWQTLGRAVPMNQVNTVSNAMN